MTRRVMFIAGEASGDAHAAPIVAALRARRVDVFGAGGPKMHAAGMGLSLDLTKHAVVGFVEVLKNYGKFKRIFNDLISEAERRKPDAVVLVDFPGFNLRFAAQMKKRGFKVIYYISPQLWAWHASRAKQIERDVALMLTIFPFEKAWYAKHAPKLRVEFAGHPLAEKKPKEEPSRRDATAPFRSQLRSQKLVLLLPGSREREVAKLWPVFVGIVERMPDVKFVAAAVNDTMAGLMKHPRVKVEVGRARELMQRATLAITASGTATMECAFYGCPMIVVYKVNWLTYLVGRAVVKVNWLGMPNVIAGRSIVPEFIQHDAQPGRIVASATELLRDDTKRETMRRELATVIGALGGAGASRRAAELIMKEIA